MKKRLALTLAGASAVLVAGWRLVQGMSDRAEPATDPVAVAPGVPAEATDGPPPEEKPSSGSKKTPGPVSGASRAELYETAQVLGIAGRSKMNKAELIEAIEAAS